MEMDLEIEKHCLTLTDYVTPVERVHKLLISLVQSVMSSIIFSDDHIQSLCK